MTELSAALCSDCPLRGLCIGDKIGLTTRAVHYNPEGLAHYPGIEIVGTDRDGVKNVIHRYTPTTVAYPGRKGDIITQNTNPRDATRDDEIYEAVANNPDPLLGQIAMRAQECGSPNVQFADTGRPYNSSCRAADTEVLRALIALQAENLK